MDGANHSTTLRSCASISCLHFPAITAAAWPVNSKPSIFVAKLRAVDISRLEPGISCDGFRFGLRLSFVGRTGSGLEVDTRELFNI
ncbi:MAG: hypothetical protein ACLQU2_19985 [Candidatus Binataceae bacterium]